MGARRHRRRPPKVGWWCRTRLKVSRYASKGYAYEANLRYTRERWTILQPHDYADVITALRECAHVRVIEHHDTVRIYLRSRADLMLLRLLTDDLFRVYRLVPVAQG
jgi:hypothetical protein